MTKKILCPTDGSDHALIGVDCASELARQSGAEVTICAVNLAIGGVRGPTINHWRPEEVTGILDHAVARAKATGLEKVAGVELIAREAGPAIIAYAEEHGFDHIVMGTGDKRGIRRLVLGSVATDVAGKSHCTVTVAR
jgi:nucleotide-binding universal stress UspA family protein